MAFMLPAAPKRVARSRAWLLLAVAATVCLAAVLQAAQSLSFTSSRQGAVAVSRRQASAFRGRTAVFARGGADEDDDEDIDFYELDAASLKQGQELEGVVTKIVKFGAFVDIGLDSGKEALVPTSKLQDARTENVEDVVKVGDTVKCWVVEVKPGDKVTLSMSQKKVFAPKPTVKADVSLFTSLVDGDFVEGTVVGTRPFGAFVELKPPNGEAGTAQGLVHITQLRDGFTRNVDEVVKTGQAVKVKVMSVDIDKGQIQLTMKGAPKPVVDVTSFIDLSDEEWITGSVKSIVNFGAFVEVPTPSGGPSVQGLVHISQIQDSFIEDPAEVLEVGMDVKVRVIEVDTEKGKLSLSMKEKAAEKVEDAVAA